MKTRKIITSVVVFFAFATAIAQNLPSYVPANGLAAWYSLNTNALDSSLNNYNLEPLGIILPDTDRLGVLNNVKYFGGNTSGSPVNKYNLPTNATSAFNNLNSGTISFWVKIKQLDVTGHPFGFDNSFIVKQKHGVNTQLFIGLKGGTSKIRFHLDGALPSSSTFESISSLNIGQWYNITVSWDGSFQYIYINGLLDNSIVSSQTLTNLENPSYFSIGSFEGLGTNGSFSVISDVGFWTRSLTQAEITQLYIGTGNGSPLAAAQNFCGAARVASLKAVGTDLKWYDSETATTPLAITTKLITQTYYVSQNIAGTESPRTAVVVTASPATSAIVVTNGLLLPRVTIGTQTWTKKNLDVATYSDGTPIPQVTDPAKWAALTTGAWCYYDNNPLNGATYGKLYNWYAVAGIYNEASKTDLTLRKKLAPTGYHVPTDDEWTTLNDYLGGANVAGGKMKSTTLWNSPNQDATNSSGFTGLPGGYRYYNGSFNAIGYGGYWWSSSEIDATTAWLRGLSYGNGTADSYNYDKYYGFSVRCLRD